MRKLTALLTIFFILLNFSFQKINLDLGGADVATLLEANKSVLTDYFSLTDASVTLVKGFFEHKSPTASISQPKDQNSPLPARQEAPARKQPAAPRYSITDLNNCIIAMSQLPSLRGAERRGNLIRQIKDEIASPFRLAMTGVDGATAQPSGLPQGFLCLHLLLMFMLFFYSRPRGAIDADILTVSNTQKIQS